MERIRTSLQSFKTTMDSFKGCCGSSPGERPPPVAQAGRPVRAPTGSLVAISTGGAPPRAVPSVAPRRVPRESKAERSTEPGGVKVHLPKNFDSKRAGDSGFLHADWWLATPMPAVDEKRRAGGRHDLVSFERLDPGLPTGLKPIYANHINDEKGQKALNHLRFRLTEKSYPFFMVMKPGAGKHDSKGATSDSGSGNEVFHVGAICLKLTPQSASIRLHLSDRKVIDMQYRLMNPSDVFEIFDAHSLITYSPSLSASNVADNPPEGFAL